MRIALVSQQYPPETAGGGIGTQAHLKAHGLASLGHEVYVVSRHPAGRREERRDGDVHVIRIPEFDDRLFIRSDPAYWLTYSAQVAAELSALDARAPLDVVDFPEWGCEGYVHLVNESESRRLRSVVQLHGPLVMLAHTLGWPEPDSPLYRTGTELEGACLRLADLVYSSSACSADWAAEHYGIERDRIAVVHAGVDTRLFRPRPGARGSRPTVVFAGRVVWNKGVETLVDAACLLAAEVPDLRLRVVGRGEPDVVTALAKRAARAGRRDVVEFTGFLQRETLAEELAAADVFAAPSLYEGGPGLVYLEAMACGVPVVACRGSGADEVVADGDNGLLVRPGDADELADALLRLLSDDDERTALGGRARAFVLADADSGALAQRLEALYESTLVPAG